MKHLITSGLLIAALSGCATQAGQPESVRATQAMTDMDGRPIAPSAYGGPSVGFGIGLGGWGRHGGVGIGLGTGW